MVLVYDDVLLQFFYLLKQLLLDLGDQWLLEARVAEAVLPMQVDQLEVRVDEEGSVLSVQFLQDHANFQLSVNPRVELVDAKRSRNITSDLEIYSVPLGPQVLQSEE